MDNKGELKKRLVEIPIKAGWQDIDREEGKQLIIDTIDSAKKDYPKQVLVSDEGVEHTWFSDETHQQHISKWFEKWFGENE